MVGRIRALPKRPPAYQRRKVEIGSSDAGVGEVKARLSHLARGPRFAPPAIPGETTGHVNGACNGTLGQRSGEAELGSQPLGRGNRGAVGPGRA